jgi:hypothetical protein
LSVIESQQKGWICPVCGKGLAPWKESCDCVKQITIKVNTEPLHRDFYFYKSTGDPNIIIS